MVGSFKYWGGWSERPTIFFNMGGIKNTLVTIAFAAWIKKIENNYLSMIIITSFRLRKPGVDGSL